eukprot:CAMPEP_0206033820 /NCGR_PEP_ID=MMETSP1466-20131121/928_1 /ASSEMBLY_ACC=CAM_ASM_001126 /TAXON_ID=44452 /ORGANISM="Pavlova gyrans, Strain CCMP608" /LENGTH=72 /DNA_ID=CAMNT_0053408055 /DNA_START=1 /DNA_END=216 /DNA_ORIENTATION=-
MHGNAARVLDPRGKLARWGEAVTHSYSGLGICIDRPKHPSMATQAPLGGLRARARRAHQTWVLVLASSSASW